MWNYPSDRRAMHLQHESDPKISESNGKTPSGSITCGSDPWIVGDEALYKMSAPIKLWQNSRSVGSGLQLQNFLTYLYFTDSMLSSLTHLQKCNLLVKSITLFSLIPTLVATLSYKMSSCFFSFSLLLPLLQDQQSVKMCAHICNYVLFPYVCILFWLKFHHWLFSWVVCS